MCKKNVLFGDFVGIVKDFDIEKVKTDHGNLSNPLFAVCRSLSRHVEGKTPIYKLLPLVNKFFTYFDRSEFVTDTQNRIIKLLLEDYERALVIISIVLALVISEYSDLYY